MCTSKTVLYHNTCLSFGILFDQMLEINLCIMQDISHLWTIEVAYNKTTIFLFSLSDIHVLKCHQQQICSLCVSSTCFNLIIYPDTTQRKPYFQNSESCFPHIVQYITLYFFKQENSMGGASNTYLITRNNLYLPRLRARQSSSSSSPSSIQMFLISRIMGQYSPKASNCDNHENSKFEDCSS